MIHINALNKQNMFFPGQYYSYIIKQHIFLHKITKIEITTVLNFLTKLREHGIFCQNSTFGQLKSYLRNHYRKVVSTTSLKCKIIRAGLQLLPEQRIVTKQCASNYRFTYIPQFSIQYVAIFLFKSAPFLL